MVVSSDLHFVSPVEAFLYGVRHVLRLSPTTEAFFTGLVMLMAHLDYKRLNKVPFGHRIVLTPLAASNSQECLIDIK